jgi:ATP/maltotriose-dependent transcriptional regulator MalT/DNA-binding SARP family transcriptional activator
MEIIDLVFKPLAIKKEHLKRNKIIELLNNNKNKNILLITAPSGYGKSIVASMFFEELKENKVWLSFPDNYFDFNAFLDHLIYILNKNQIIKIFQENGEITSSFFTEEEKVVELLNTFAKYDKELYIFLDSFESINFTEKYKNLLNLWINFLPENIHLVITINKNFPISLAKLKMNNKSFEITKKDLKFTFDELNVYINKSRLDISLQDLLKVYQISQGMPFFINILITNLKLKTFKNADQLFDSSNEIDDFILLLTEGLSEELTIFLKIISLMDEITPKVCSKILEAKNDLKIYEYLEELVNLNLIEKIDDSTYYMHEIFQLAVKKNIPEKEKLEIYKKLLLIYEEEKDPYGQFYCLIHLNDVEKVSEFFLNHSDLLIKDYSIIKEWLDSIPTNFFEANYELYFYRGVIEEKYSMFDEALTDYMKVKKNIEKIDNQEIKQIIDTQIIGIYWHKEDYEKVIQLGIELLPKISKDNYQSIVSLQNLLGTSYADLSNLEEAKKHLYKALDLCEENNFEEMKSWILNNIAYNIHLIEGDLESTEKYYRQALKMFDSSGDLYGKALLTANLADYYININQLEKAQKYLETYNEIYIQTKNIAYFPVLKILQAKLYVEQNNLKKASESLNEAKNYYSRSNFLQANYFAVRSSYLLKSGLSQKAYNNIESAIKIAKTCFNKYQILNFELQKVRILIHLKQFEKAIPIVNKIIDTAKEPNAKLILAQALLFKMFLNEFLNIPKAEEDIEQLLMLIKSNNYYFVFEKFPEITKFLEGFIVKVLKIELPHIQPPEKFNFEELSKISVSEPKTVLSFPKIYLFGGFKLIYGDETLSMNKVKNQKALDLFKFLALNYNQWIIQDVLIEYFWPKLPVQKAKQNLYVAIHDIRKRLKEFGLKEDYISHKNKNYKFNTDKPYYLDYEDFLNRYEEGTKMMNNKKYLKAKEIYLEAKEIYSYGLLPANIYDDWAISKIEDAEEKYLKILSSLFLLEKEKDSKQAENYLEEYLHINPFSDEMNKEFINLLIKNGERKRALDYYNFVNKLYEKELGTVFNSIEISYFIKEFQI